jgi:hypothetical protein
MTPVANYQREHDAFDALLAPTCSQNIMLVSGESGIGKTTLLTSCLQRVPRDRLTLRIQLRQRTTPVSEIFRRAGHDLGWAQFPRFTVQVAAFQGIPSVEIDRNWLIGIKNRITIVLQVEDVDREQRRAALTQAWFEDLQAMGAQVLMAFDTYEQATPDVQAWIQGPFLARVANLATLRVLVAGQQVPDPNNIEWGHCCTYHELHGVPEVTHWLPVVENLERTIPVDNPCEWLDVLCQALRGAPKEIMQVIKGLPLKKAVV